MSPLIAFNIWQGIEEYRQDFEPPVGNQVLWEDSPFTAMIIRGPHARRDFHVDPSNEMFLMFKGDTILESMQDGKRQDQVIRAGKLFLVPALTPHAPHRPPDTRGLVIEVNRTPEQTESLRWFCEPCHAPLHKGTSNVADIEGELKAAIEPFETSVERHTYRRCGSVQPEQPPVLRHPSHPGSEPWCGR